MNYRLFGRTGVKVAPLALGTANFGRPTAEEEAQRILHTALEAGINLIDTADSYTSGESERIIGRFLAGTGKRNQVFLATKAHYPMGPGPNARGNSRAHLMQACEEAKAGKMPMPIYLVGHPEARLTDADIAILCKP